MTVWDEIVGQEKTVETLKKTIAIDNIKHAWLFSGPAGSGRSIVAKAFATALICENRENVGCGVCANCYAAKKNIHPDIHIEITENTIFSVEKIRTLIAKSYQKPSNSTWRIIIIEDADRMSERTSNVLLKTLEEPPPQTVWMLCTPNPTDMLPTISSRCQKIRLQLPELEKIVELLVTRDNIAPDLAKFTAQISQNHIGMSKYLAKTPEALQRREKVLELFPPKNSATNVVQIAAKIMVLVEEATKSELETRSLFERKKILESFGLANAKVIPANIRSQIKQLAENQKRRSTRYGRDVLDRALLDVAGLYRDVLLQQLQVSSPIINVDLETKIIDMAKSGFPEKTLQNLNTIYGTRKLLNTNGSTLLMLENMLFSII